MEKKEENSNAPQSQKTAVAQQAQDEANKTLHTQSSKASEVIRKIMFVLIASCWATVFVDGKLITDNRLLVVTLCLCFLYCILDALHYFVDACGNFHLSKQIEKYPKKYDDKDKIDPLNNKIADRSFALFCAKFAVCIVSCIGFVFSICFN